MSEPTEEAILLALVKAQNRWSRIGVSADEIAGHLVHFGFERPSVQGLSARLRAMCAEDLPLVVREMREMVPPYEYKPTIYARTLLFNNGWRFDPERTSWAVPPALPETGENDGE